MSRTERGWSHDWLVQQIERGHQRWQRADQCPGAVVATRELRGPIGPATAAGAPFPLVNACRNYGLAEPVPEYKFHPLRRWRFDYAWPLHLVAVEIEGGIWSKGRHTRGKGYLDDLEKYNAATLLGWRLLRYAPDQISQAVRDLRLALLEKAA